MFTLTHPLTLSIALRCALSRKAHKFAFFVALMSSLGIAIGVCALITVSAVMQGLQDRLKQAVLATTAHAVVEVKDSDTLPFLLSLSEVTAVLPFLQGQVLVQSPQGLQLAQLQGYDPALLIIKTENGTESAAAQPELPDFKKADETVIAAAAENLGLIQTPQNGSYELIAPRLFILDNNLDYGDKVRLISTQGARYTPLGITPTQRLFTLSAGASLALPAGSEITLLSALEDVRRLLRADQPMLRIFLTDPFLIEDIAPKLQEAGLNFTDWRESQGDFFRAVALEKLSMSVMLCLIILTASFNILSALTMLVSARVREIAVLKTLGCTKGTILGIFMLQGLICAAAGIVLGVALGVPLALHAQSVLNLFGISIMRGTLPIVLNFGQVGLIALCCLLLAALCTLYPALKAAAAEPAQHLASL